MNVKSTDVSVPQPVVNNGAVWTYRDSLGTFVGPFDNPGLRGEFSPDGNWIYLQGQMPGASPDTAGILVAADGSKLVWIRTDPKPVDTGLEAGRGDRPSILGWLGSERLLVKVPGRAPGDPVRLLAFDLKGRPKEVYRGSDPGQLISATAAGDLAVFETPEGQLHRLSIQNGDLSPVSPDEPGLVSGRYRLTPWAPGTDRSPDGGRLLVIRSAGRPAFTVTSADGESLLLDVRSGALTPLADPGRRVRSASFSPDGRRVAVVGEQVKGEPVEGEPGEGEATPLHVVDAASGSRRSLDSGRRQLTGAYWLDDVTLVAQAVEPVGVVLFNLPPAALSGDGSGYDRAGTFIPTNLKPWALFPNGALLVGDWQRESLPGGVLIHYDGGSFGSSEKWRERLYRLPRNGGKPQLLASLGTVERYRGGTLVILEDGPVTGVYTPGKDGFLPLSEALRPGVRPLAAGGGRVAWEYRGHEGYYVRIRSFSALENAPVGDRSRVQGPVPGPAAVPPDYPLPARFWPDEEAVSPPLRVGETAEGRLTAAGVVARTHDWHVVAGDGVTLRYNGPPVVGLSVYVQRWVPSETDIEFAGRAVMEDGGWTYRLSIPHEDLHHRVFAEGWTPEGKRVVTWSLLLRGQPAEAGFRRLSRGKSPRNLPEQQATRLRRQVAEHRFLVIQNGEELEKAMAITVEMGSEGWEGDPPPIDWERELVLAAFRGPAAGAIAFWHVAPRPVERRYPPDERVDGLDSWFEYPALGGDVWSWDLVVVPRPRSGWLYGTVDFKVGSPFIDDVVVAATPTLLPPHPDVAAGEAGDENRARVVAAAHAVLERYLDALKRGDGQTAASLIAGAVRKDGVLPEWTTPLPRGAELRVAAVEVLRREPDDGAVSFRVEVEVSGRAGTPRPALGWHWQRRSEHIYTIIREGDEFKVVLAR